MYTYANVIQMLLKFHESSFYNESDLNTNLNLTSLLPLVKSSIA